MFLRTPLLLFSLLMAACSHSPPVIELPPAEETGHALGARSAAIREIQILNSSNPGEMNSLTYPIPFVDAWIPINPATPLGETVKDDFARYFSARTSRDPASTRVVRVLIRDAAAFWVQGGAEKMPIVGIFTLYSDHDYHMNLTADVQLLEGDRLVGAHTVQKQTTIRAPVTTLEDIVAGYRLLVSEYRKYLYQELDAAFTGKYLSGATPASNPAGSRETPAPASD